MKKFSEEDPNILGLGLPRRWEGAIIGILSVFIIGLLCWGASYTPFIPILFGVSSILPAALIGSLISSKTFTQKTFGLILMVIYIVLWMIFAFYLNIVLD